MRALAKGAARASGLRHHLTIFDAAWEIIYRVLRSPEGARLRAISTLGDQSHRTAKAVAWITANYARPLHLVIWRNAGSDSVTVIDGAANSTSTVSRICSRSRSGFESSEWKWRTVCVNCVFSGATLGNP
jgi:hypothetical protein